MDYDTEKVFDSLLFKVGPLWSLRYPNKPGYLIEKLSSKDREAISKLKSDDINNIRLPWACPHRERRIQCNCGLTLDKQIRLKFDKKLKMPLSFK
jgi:hypothetical protein